MTCFRARLVICCAALVLPFAAQRAAAAELTLTPVVSEILQRDLLPFPAGETPSLHELQSVPLTVKVDYFFEIADLQENQLGFGNLVFNVDLFRLQQNAIRTRWRPDTSLIAIEEGPDGLVPKWDDNADIGPSNSDLRSVFVGLFPRDFGDPAVDQRYRIGQEGPVYIGSTYIDRNGAQPAMLRPEYNVADKAFSIYDDDKMLVAVTDPVVLGEIQLGMPANHQNLRVLDWEAVNWTDPAARNQTFRLKNINVDVSFTGDTMFPPNEHFGGPDIWPLDSGERLREHGLLIPMDFTDASQTVTATLEFSRVVTDVEFGLQEISQRLATEELAGFADQVAVLGFLGNGAVAPLLISRGVLVDGNVLTGVPADGPHGAIVRFDQFIDRIELTYGNALGAVLDPGLQSFGVEDVHFTINNPEPGSIALAAIGCGVLVGRRYWKSRPERT